MENRSLQHQSRIQGLIYKIEQYRKELNSMNENVRLYLGDKIRYTYPQFEKLIDEIHAFEREVHSFYNKDIQFRLEGLLDSLMIHKRIWERLFAEDDQKIKAEAEEHDRFLNAACRVSTDIWKRERVDTHGIERRVVQEDPSRVYEREKTPRRDPENRIHLR